MLLTLLKA